MYRSLPELIEGWSKNIYLGGRRSFPEDPALRATAPLMVAAALSFWLLPPVTLAVSGGLCSAAALAVGLSAVFWTLSSVGMRIPFYYGLGYPLGALMALYIAARSTWRGERKVEWRGRTSGSRPWLLRPPAQLPPSRSTTTFCAGIRPPSTRPSGAIRRWNSTVPIATRSESFPMVATFPSTVCPPPRLKNGT
jgi:hypothetical protein